MRMLSIPQECLTKDCEVVKVIDEQNIEIKNLAEENNSLKLKMQELEEENASFGNSINEAAELICKKNERISQLENSLDAAVKQKAKDILSTLMRIVKKSDGFLSEEVIRIMAKQNNVEVE